MKKENIMKLIYALAKEEYNLLSRDTDRDIKDFIINNINYQDESGETLLTIAIEKFNFKLAKNLITNGADKSLKDKYGRSYLKIFFDYHRGKVHYGDNSYQEFMKFFDLLEN